MSFFQISKFRTASLHFPVMQHFSTGFFEFSCDSVESKEFKANYGKARITSPCRIN